LAFYVRLLIFLVSFFFSLYLTSELIFGATSATGGKFFCQLRKFLEKQRKMLYNLTPNDLINA